MFDRCTTGFFDRSAQLNTAALLVVHRGRLVYERYGRPADSRTRLRSWSIAKSVTHALVGLAVERGLDISAPAAVPEWYERRDDPRQAITVEHLLRMRSGLRFATDYADLTKSDEFTMLFGAGVRGRRGGLDDMASFAADMPLDHIPGTHFEYSSGTTLILCRLAAKHLGTDDVAGVLRRELFEPIGMTSASIDCDRAGTFIGSSFVHATARDFARFTTLYLRDGVWDGRRLLPAGWIDHARSENLTPTDYPHDHGAHFWRWRDPVAHLGAFGSHGYEGQATVAVPSCDLVVTRLGATSDAELPLLRDLVRGVMLSFAPREASST